MNSNDAEVVWAILKKSNYEKTDSLSTADIALFVTCALRDRTESKIWERLGTIQYYRKQNHFKIGILGKGFFIQSYHKISKDNNF